MRKALAQRQFERGNEPGWHLLKRRPSDVPTLSLHTVELFSAYRSSVSLCLFGKAGGGVIP
ncbi:MAG: hypothetical protein VB094_04985 [Oscillibacter sp.]|nr:hypothetical protein [Oscillibacter sp.]